MPCLEANCSQRKFNLRRRKRSHCYAQQKEGWKPVTKNPENERYFTKTMQMKVKTLIIGDPIVKGINMRELNK